MQTSRAKHEKQPLAKNRRPALTLFSVSLIIAGIWGIVLPRIAELPAMQEKINHLDQKGIDPGAFFYSDHPNAFQKHQRPTTNP